MTGVPAGSTLTVVGFALREPSPPASVAENAQGCGSHDHHAHQHGADAVNDVVPDRLDDPPRDLFDLSAPARENSPLRERQAAITSI
jgi:hypothetical protein